MDEADTPELLLRSAIRSAVVGLFVLMALVGAYLVMVALLHADALPADWPL